MIRINLIGTAAKRPKSAKVMPEAFAVSAPPATMLGVGLIVIALLALGGDYFYVQHQTAQLAAQLTAARQESLRLQSVRREFQENSKRRQELTQRINVIDQLKSSQLGPSSLLEAVRRSVDATPGVWLTAVSQKEGMLSIDGSALNLSAVANLMTALRRSGYFQQIALHESVEATGKTGPNPYTFTLTAAPDSNGEGGKPAAGPAKVRS